MNTRERILLIVLLSILGGGALLLGTFQWFIKPMREYDKQIADMRRKKNEAESNLNQYLEDRKMLELARARSLPANAADAGLEYMTNYLQPLLRESGLKKATVTKSPTALDFKFTSTIPGVKTGHKFMTFQANADEVEWSAVVRALERLQRTPYEHRITSLLVTRPEKYSALDPDPKLNVTIVIETLLVAKTQTKAGLPPGLDASWIAVDHFVARQGQMPLGWGLLTSRLALQMSVPQPENRRYDQLANKNIFSGLIPYKPAPPTIIKETKPIVKEEKKPEPSINVPQFVHLSQVQTVGTQTTAYLRNFVYREPEQRLIAEPGYDTFKVVDAETRYVFHHAKVLRIDPRAVYFQIKGEIYELTMGMNIAEATRRPLSITRKRDLNLTVNPEWTAQEAGVGKDNDKAKNPTKKNPSVKGPAKSSK